MYDKVKVVADTFHIANQIDEYGVVFRTAFSLFKTGNMLGNELAAGTVDFFFQLV